ASKRARIWILAAGSLFNLVFAFLLLTIAFRINSIQDPIVSLSQVVPGSPAEAAGLLPGDVLVSVDGLPIASTSDLLEQVSANRGRDITLVVMRAEQEVVVSVRPRLPSETPEGQGAMGVGLSQTQA
ncbi:MAG TPA: M50 family metallopeptidase, partial [Anaerolineales bacterium]|nr:M50 family metallopeptidase [Anaerolineales bacterium]